MSAQATKPDTTHFVLNACDLSGEIEHQAILRGENDAHRAPRCSIRADHRIQISILVGALDKLADKSRERAVMPSDAVRNLGVTCFSHGRSRECVASLDRL